MLWNILYENCENMSVVRKKAGIKNPSGRRIKKIDYCLYQTAIFSKTNLCLNYI